RDLGVNDAVFLPDEDQQLRIAWVESTGQEGLDWEIGNSKYFRSLGFPWGGLYVRARDVLTFVSAFLPGKESEALSAAARKAMITQNAAPPDAPASVAPTQRDVTWDPTRPPRARTPLAFSCSMSASTSSTSRAMCSTRASASPSLRSRACASAIWISSTRAPSP